MSDALYRIRQAAQRAANAANDGRGAPMAILNLNPFSPLYAVREWDDRFHGHKTLVERVNPATIDQGG